MLWMPDDLDGRGLLLRWAEARLPYAHGFDRLKAAPVGIWRNGEPVAVVVYHAKRGGCVEMSIAAETPRWATRDTVTALLAWPFVVLGVRRITCMVATLNTRSRRLCEGLGFVWEGCLAEVYPDDDADIFGMTRTIWERSPWYAPEGTCPRKEAA